MKELRLFLVLLIVISIISVPSLAAVRLPAVISGNMVLQQGLELNIWGWASPGEKVTVNFNGSEAATEASQGGEWRIILPAQEAGGPYTMEVAGENRIVLDNILVGEVWVCSGQSNMEKQIGPMPGQKPVLNWVQEMEAADYPQIRLFHIPRATSGIPVDDVDAEWVACSPQTIPGFSAVGYFFGREIHRKTGVPVGLIMTCWGGTRVEPWTPPSGFEQVPETSDITAEVKAANQDFKRKTAAYLTARENWEQLAMAADLGKALPALPLEPVHSLNDRSQPTGLYNAMVAPITCYGIRGAIWYQGEANRGDRLNYAAKMKALIKGWRTEWDQGDFPFYLVQLAPFNYENTDVVGHDYPEAGYLAEIWVAQLKTLELPHTGMAVTTDITELYDIHPTNKQAVGKRLALWALAKDYGETGLVFSGPLYQGIQVEGGRILVSFDHTGSGLASRDGEALNWFEIAGKDGVFKKAEARIEGDRVAVSSPEVSKPEAVRFGWHELAVPNLMNKEGLPASPFNSLMLP